MDLRAIELGMGLDWTDLSQYRDRWSALENVVMNLPVSWNADISELAEKVQDSQRLSSM